MKIPKLEEAKRFIYEASLVNPGPWVKHSYTVALAASKIAERCEQLDASNAYTLDEEMVLQLDGMLMMVIFF